MFDKLRRRTFLGGTVGALTGLAGCGSQEDDRAQTATETAVATTAASTESPTASETDSVAEETETLGNGGSFVLPAAYVIDKRDAEVFAVNGRTLRREYSGEAGRDDAKVIQAALEGVQDGGRVFIRNNEYTIDDRIELKSSRTEVVSDYARLTAKDHPEAPDEVQTDFAIGEGVENPARYVRIAGLVLDGNKPERTTGTRVMNIRAGSEHITIENCAIIGGKKGPGAGTGYGIGEANESDFITINNCLFRDNDRHAYHPSANHHVITNSTFLNNSTKGGDVFDLPSNYGIVSNNHFENNGHGLKVDAGQAGNITITGNLFVNNYIQDEDSTGQIELIKANAQSITITGNEFRLPDSPEGQTDVKHFRIRWGERQEEPRNIDTLRISDNVFAGGKGRAIELKAVGEKPGVIDRVIIENNTFQNVGEEVISAAKVLKLIVRYNVIDQSAGREGFIKTESIPSGVMTGNILYNAAIGDSTRSQNNIVVAENIDFPGMQPG